MTLDLNDYVLELRELNNVTIARAALKKFNLPYTEHYMSQVVAEIKSGKRHELTNRGKGRAYFTPKDQRRVMIISDIHGWLMDERAFGAVLKVLEKEEFTDLVINGDLLDFPFLSRHDKHLINKNHSVFDNYSESAEIEFTKRNVLQPIREVYKGRVIIKPGNHDERVTMPKSLNKEQLERLMELSYHYKTSDLWQMLQLKDFNMVADEAAYTMLTPNFAITHGLSVAKNAPERNIYEYTSSGTTGHTHRLNVRYINTKTESFKWLESGCLRRKDRVEYFSTGKQADWQHGFVEAVIVNVDGKPEVFAKNHEIIKGRTVFNGLLI